MPSISEIVAWPLRPGPLRVNLLIWERLSKSSIWLRSQAVRSLKKVACLPRSEFLKMSPSLLKHAATLNASKVLPLRCPMRVSACSSARALKIFRVMRSKSPCLRKAGLLSMNFWLRCELRFISRRSPMMLFLRDLFWKG